MIFTLRLNIGHHIEVVVSNFHWLIVRSSNCWNYLANNEELLDDILRRGSRDIFWHYSSERDVSNVFSISSTLINNKVIYNNYFLRY